MPYCPIDATPLTSGTAGPVVPPVAPVVPYFMNFGSANVGAQPVFSEFIRTDTRAALTQPTIALVEVSGRSSFSVDWATVPVGVSSIYYVATCNGSEVWSVITPTSG